MSETRQKTERRNAPSVTWKDPTGGLAARTPIVVVILAAGLVECVLSGSDNVNYSELLRNFSVLMAGCALTAVVEEVLFRGLLMNALLHAGERVMFHVKHRGKIDEPDDADGRGEGKGSRMFHVKHSKSRGDSSESHELQCAAGAVALVAVVGSAMVFAALHIVPAAGEPWPWEMALEAEVAAESRGTVEAAGRSEAGRAPEAGGAAGFGGAVGVEAAPGVGGAMGVAVAAGLKVMQALLFGIAMAGLRLASLSRTRCSGASASGAMEGVANLVRLDGLAVPVGVHFGFDLLYFAPVVLATGAFPLTYISTTPAEWAPAVASTVVLLWPAAWALGIARRGVLPYDDDQDRRRS